MIYKDFNGKKLSQLGFGAMRLPVTGGDDSRIDVKETEKMVAYAMEHGINYYDTAYGYHGGNSERVMGSILLKYPRDSYYLASKFPGYDLGNMGKVKEIFAEQLEKTGHDYFDFYMFHNLCEMNVDYYLDPSYGIYDYLMEMKKQGRIKHLGVSAHAEIPTLKRFLEAYGKDMEFCQLQLNYLDWTFQKDREKVELLKQYNIPVWVMEPLRGGKLAELSEEYLKVLEPYKSVGKPVDWAFRFLQSIPEVKVVLSGMSDMEQLADNIRIFEEDRPLKNEEMQAILKVGDLMQGKKSIPCTGCNYCISHCPQGLEIPRLIALYNEHVLTVESGQFGFIAPMALAAIPAEKQPKSCLHCGECEKVCPQQIKISEAMRDFVKVIG